MPAANRLPWALVLTAVLAATAPVPLSAQLGGLARKAKAALSGEKVATPEPVATPGATPSDPVRVSAADRIDAASLDLFVQALAAERSWLEERARIRKSLRTPDDYRSCAEVTTQTSVEGKKVMQMYLDAMASPDNDGSTEFMTALANKMKAEQDRIVLAACGHDPAEYGAAPIPGAAYQPSEHAAAEQVGLPQLRYAMLKERIMPFCSVDASSRGTGEARVRGIGTGIYYVYEADEVALLSPRCDELVRAMRAIA